MNGAVNQALPIVKHHRDGSFAYYTSEPIVENDLKGVAGFLLAASACEEITQQ